MPPLAFPHTAAEAAVKEERGGKGGVGYDDDAYATLDDSHAVYARGGGQGTKELVGVVGRSDSLGIGKAKTGSHSMWLYPKLSRAAAEELLKQSAMDDGTFLVRQRADVEGRPSYALSGTWKGEVTHHLLYKLMQCLQVKKL